jgi:hypothetical protein
MPNRYLRIPTPRIAFAVLAALAFTLTSTHAQAPPPAQKHRVAVMSFDYGTVQSSVSSIFGSDQDIGKGISSMLIEKLVKDGQFSVIERAALDKLLAEQNSPIVIAPIRPAPPKSANSSASTPSSSAPLPSSAATTSTPTSAAAVSAPNTASAASAPKTPKQSSRFPLAWLT